MSDMKLLKDVEWGDWLESNLIGSVTQDFGFVLKFW